MKPKLLPLLACPRCHNELKCDAREIGPDGDIVEGLLACTACDRRFPISRSIPRFVSTDGYASSFGFQWSRFRLEQIDSRNGLKLSERRFLSETAWTAEWLRGKWLLEAGCGAGRFLDIASRHAGEVIGIDLSIAADAASETLRGRQNVHLVQGSLFELPFKDGVFDGCYCIGVIQHTPDPGEALRALPRVLKPRGRLAVTIYERKPWTKFNTKYLLRPFTTRLPPETLFRAIKLLMPVLFPLTEVLFRIPGLSRAFRFLIPVANYVHESDLSLLERYRWSILDTFDALSPTFDDPQTESEVRIALSSAGITDLQRLGNPGVNAIGMRRP